MFQHTGRLKATFGLLGLALAGCTTNPEVRDQETGLTLRSAIGNTCVNGEEVLTFDINVWASTADPETDAPLVTRTGVALSDVFNVGQLNAGEGVDQNLTGIWVGGDEFIQLSPGDYIVQSSAVGTTVDLLPSEVQWQNVTVVEGQTTETVFTYQCEGQTISALDVVVLVDEGASIVGWQYGPDKFGMLCEPTEMKATFQDDIGGAVTVTFEMFATAQAGYTGPDWPTAPLASFSETKTLPAGNVPATSTWRYPHPGPAGTFYVYVTVTKIGADGIPLNTTFQALYHAYTPIFGYAFDDSPFSNQDDYWGLNSCELGDQHLLDYQCAKNQLTAPRPDRTTVCPVESLPAEVTAWYANNTPSTCETDIASWEYPGSYTPLAAGNVSGQWGGYDGTCEDTGGFCPMSFDPVWGVDGTFYPGACEAQHDCAIYSTSYCAAPPAETCDNEIDDDRDGDADCDDSDCASDPSCLPPTEVCTGGVDEDGDLDVDCDDLDCFGTPECSTP